MRKIWSVCAVAALAGAVASGAAATSSGTRHVSTAGNDVGNNCLSSPCRTIQHAVDVAGAGDTIAVAPGTYVESVTIAVRLNLVGSKGATIDATGQHNGIVISGAGAAGTRVKGFTVENAGLEGIFVVDTSHISITNNVVRDNDAFGPFHELCVANPDDCGEAVHLQTVTDSAVVDNVVQNNVGGILLTDEDGPTARNLISDNKVLDNTLDCGITLASHWFSLQAAATPDVAGVYLNLVLHNTSNRNGAAGIGIFAGPPGAAAWGNVVLGNTAMDNGLPGVAIHSHFALQYVNDNSIIGNTLSGNGPDDDAETPGNTGIAVFADTTHNPIPILPPASPIPRTTIVANRIADEDVGIYAFGATKLLGLPSNKFDSVGTPISIN